VANENSADVSVVDASTNTVVASIPTIAGGAGLAGIAAHPDGTRVYVASREGHDVVVVDTGTNAITTRVSVGGFGANVTVAPDGARAYATSSDTVDVGRGDVLVIDTSSDTVTAMIPNAAFPFGLSVTPDSARVYVVNRDTDSVWAVDATTNAVVASIAVGDTPDALGQFIGPQPVCGDGVVTFPEECDDSNTASGDGCSATCTVESGWTCTGSPSVCALTTTTTTTTTPPTSTTMPERTDHPQDALKLSLKQDTATGRAKAAWVSKSPALVLPSQPPTSVGGAFVVTGVNQTVSAPLPATDWKTNPGGTLYKFVNKLAPGGDSLCKVALVKEAKVLKVICKDSLIQLDDTAQGTVSVSLTIGADTYCSICTTPVKDEPGKFIAKGCSAPADCSAAVPTTTVTRSGNMTRVRLLIVRWVYGIRMRRSRRFVSHRMIGGWISGTSDM
jgi:cysteine-rich repeat protein/YVTN family beta-propeller protein